MKLFNREKLLFRFGPLTVKDTQVTQAILNKLIEGDKEMINMVSNIFGEILIKDWIKQTQKPKKKFFASWRNW